MWGHMTMFQPYLRIGCLEVWGPTLLLELLVQGVAGGAPAQALLVLRVGRARGFKGEVQK